MLHAFAALAWLPVLAFLIYSVNIRIQGKYFIALLAASGLDNQTGIVNTLFLYRNDLLLFGALIPLLIAISFVFLRRRTAIILWSMVIASTQLLLYSNLQSWGQVGRFLNWLGMDACDWASRNEEILDHFRDRHFLRAIESKFRRRLYFAGWSRKIGSAAGGEWRGLHGDRSAQADVSVGSIGRLAVHSVGPSGHVAFSSRLYVIDAKCAHHRQFPRWSPAVNSG